MQCKLAIVIPAYKDTFFAQTLESIASQTCKDFILYIGDDASPNNLSNIVVKYNDRIDIVYKRFEENVGGKDLVAQWKRCIELTQGEEWIWLFSDDDMMHPQCVESFYEEIKYAPLYDLYRFNVDVIDKKNRVICTCLAPRDVISSLDLYMLKQKGIMNSFVVEYVFSRRVYEELNGFQYFDLAWGSDLATWMKFAQRKGAKNISDGKILWRSSGENITTRTDDLLLERKLIADMFFLRWVNTFFGSTKIKWYNSNISAKIVNGSGMKLTLSQVLNVLKAYTDNSCMVLLLIILVFIYRPYFFCKKLLRVVL